MTALAECRGKCTRALAAALAAWLSVLPAQAEYKKALEPAALDCLPQQVALFDDMISGADVIAAAVLEECSNRLHAREEPFLGNDLLSLQNWQKIARPLALQAVLRSRVKERGVKQ